MAIKVKAWYDKITLLTYLIGPADPNPSYFGSNRLNGRNYPYSNKDIITCIIVDMEYEAIYPENEYPRLMVIPGTVIRVWSLFEKLKKMEVWYRNIVVKPAEVGACVAWITVGNRFFTNHTLGFKGPYLTAIIKLLNAIGTLTLVYAFRYGKAIIVSPLVNEVAPVITILLLLTIYFGIPHQMIITGIAIAIIAVFLIA